MATKREKTLRVGLLVAASLTVLALFVFFIGAEQKIFARKNEYDVRLENVSGVSAVNQYDRQITVSGNGPLLANVAAALAQHNIAPADLRVQQGRNEQQASQKCDFNEGEFHVLLNVAAKSGFDARIL